MALRPRSLSLILFLSFLAQPILGQPVDFFAPQFTRADLVEDLKAHPKKERHEVFMGKGGEGHVYAVASRTERGIETFALKKFYPDTYMEDNIQALKLLSELEAAGHLGDFKVVKIEEINGRDLKTQLIEGQRLWDLLGRHSQLPEFQLLWERYRKALYTVRANLKSLGYFSWHLGAEDESVCKPLLVPATSTESESVIFYPDEELEDGIFSIEPVNVMVEYGTGQFYIIDPL